MPGIDRQLVRDARELDRGAAAEAPGAAAVAQLAAVERSAGTRASTVSAFDIREPIEWKIPPLSIPSAKVRAPPAPANASVSAPTHGSPAGLAAMNRPPPKPGLQFAWASPR